MHLGDLQIDPAVSGKVIRARIQKAEKGRSGRFTLRKVIIGDGKSGLLQHFHQFIVCHGLLLQAAQDVLLQLLRANLLRRCDMRDRPDPATAAFGMAVL